MRHPNLVTLIGTCSEKSSLVYEYLPNGSLEDRLACQGGTPPLTWQVRTRIIGEICRALLFLHSNKPNPIVHGDLKPANILLDANLVSKLSDFGISRLLIESNTNTLVYRTEYPRGTFTYMDPEFLSSGEITVKSDVYSFGIIILRLLTGKPPANIAADVEDAIESNSLHMLIDESAGEWPFVQAEQLANLGLRCAETRRRRRPDLVSEWKLVESLMKAASLTVLPSFKSQLDDKGLPSYFMCPIFQVKICWISFKFIKLLSVEFCQAFHLHKYPPLSVIHANNNEKWQQGKHITKYLSEVTLQDLKASNACINILSKWILKVKRFLTR